MREMLTIGISNVIRLLQLFALVNPSEDVAKIDIHGHVIKSRNDLNSLQMSPFFAVALVPDDGRLSTTGSEGRLKQKAVGYFLDREMLTGRRSDAYEVVFENVSRYRKHVENAQIFDKYRDLSNF